jgi:hypothetical protein
MSRVLELPDPLFEALEKAATETGTTPIGWLAGLLQPNPMPAGLTLADTFQGRLGTVATRQDQGLGSEGVETWADHLAEKRRQGTL